MYISSRCRAIQVLADGGDPDADKIFDASNARNIVMCCLCPQYHGGLKPTTDGRWVIIHTALILTDLSYIIYEYMTQYDSIAVYLRHSFHFFPQLYQQGKVMNSNSHSYSNFLSTGTCLLCIMVKKRSY